MDEFQGFWSYVHADDEAEGGRIARLAHDVARQFELLTGETIALFLDLENIDWGEDWKKQIDASLASVAFFIPVITPRYFTRSECRRELQFFARRATELGMRQLVLPLLYVDFPEFHPDPARDGLIALVRTFQYEDWRDLRFCEPSSEAYRRGVARLADLLVTANRRAEDVIPSKEPGKEESVDAADDAPGLLDRLATAERALPRWNEVVQEITKENERITEIMMQATEDMKRGDANGSGFGARLAVSRRTAGQLADPVEKICKLSNEYATLVNEVDFGFRIMIERAPVEARTNPETKAMACSFFGAIRKLSAAAHSGLSSIQSMIDAVRPVESMSRDLRPVLRRLRTGLATMVQARKVSDEWVQLIEATDLTCQEGDPDN